jgi:hypothetical protein
MKKHTSFLLLIILIITSCSTGKKALQKGDYFSAVLKSVQRLRSNPDSKKAINVLSEGYGLAISWSQEEIDQALSSNDPFKWGKSVDLMKQVNHLAEEIRLAPAARKIIAAPKMYSSEIEIALNKAAEERYIAGVVELENQSRESAREAYFQFLHVGDYISNYKDVNEKLLEAKDLATLNVILKAIPVNTKKYKLSAEFFYDQVFEYLNKKFPSRSFVNFYSPIQAEQLRLNHPDMVVRLEFYDFMVGNTVQSEKEEQIKRRVEINKKDTTKTEYRTYTVKLKTYTDQVNSGGLLEMRIVNFGSNKLLKNDRIPGSFTWVNDYALFVGDKEALSNKQLDLTNRKAVPLPPGQELFIEFTKPIYDQLTGKLNRFFKNYD